MGTFSITSVALHLVSELITKLSIMRYVKNPSDAAGMIRVKVLMECSNVSSDARLVNGN
jgi:hypothetical protein